MDYTQKIISLLQQAQGTAYSASIDTTLKITKYYREVSDHPELIDKIMSLIIIYKRQEEHIATLSQRESQIFNLIGLGFKTKDIAIMLKLSEATVSTHRKNIIKKLRISGVGSLQSVAMQYADSEKNTQ